MNLIFLMGSIQLWAMQVNKIICDGVNWSLCFTNLTKNVWNLFNIEHLVYTFFLSIIKSTHFLSPTLLVYCCIHMCWTWHMINNNNVIIIVLTIWIEALPRCSTLKIRFLRLLRVLLNNKLMNYGHFELCNFKIDLSP